MLYSSPDSTCPLKVLKHCYHLLPFFKYRYYFNLMFLNCLSYLVLYLKKFSSCFYIYFSFVTFSSVGNLFICIILYYFSFFFNVFWCIYENKCYYSAYNSVSVVIYFIFVMKTRQPIEAGEYP